MSFPLLFKLEDIYPKVKDNPYIKLVDKEDYKVLIYTHQDRDTFNNEYDLECRGLVFNKNNFLIRRPFHKFFNIDEKEFTQYNLMHSKCIDDPAHVVLDKLDGSMVTPVWLEGEWKWMTKAGITDVSKKVEAWVKYRPEYLNLAAYLGTSTTCIFEWEDKDEPIVLHHEKNDLKLLAIRDINSGMYVGYNYMRRLAEEREVPVVPNTRDMYDLARIKDREEEEGVVIRYSDGQMVKLKTDWYVKLHRFVNITSSLRNIIHVFITEDIDDVLPKLHPEKRKIMQDLIEDFKYRMAILANAMSDIVTNAKSIFNSKKEFSLNSKLDKLTTFLVFRFWDIEDKEDWDMLDTLYNILEKNYLGSNKKFEDFNNKYLRMKIDGTR